ncbi:DGQHR domain-containing protein [Flavobacterium psychrotrophum]|uniref:DGQHR domain-containing protein n=1 Tax=Flavobacterium psychrotrophum TaxID=2294119 RepID=UPI000E31E615|nr:DGQHR domain-containing protein [Flavobacterium psychrotrophum]
MAFLSDTEVNRIKSEITQDTSSLGKIYKSKKSQFENIAVNHSDVVKYNSDGWEEYTKPLKTKTPLRRLKGFFTKFEDDIWCQFYELGFRKISSKPILLPYSKNEGELEEINIVAIHDETIFIITCKANEVFSKAESFAEEFSTLKQKLDGFKKLFRQIYGDKYKVKYIFATHNIRFDLDSPDLEVLKSSKSFLYDNNAYSYINNIIKSYKSSSLYQFFGLIFKNELINLDKIEIPAVQGMMGNKKYYMFSIEPHLLLKMGFILHRTKANVSEFPTYQRLLVPKRLKGITKFIDDGGYFPNSIIVNFNSSKHSIHFDASSKLTSSNSCFGTLKIPNSYGIAYIIDGQHRVYGYAGSKYLKNNTIPVVAFDGLDTIEQLEIFMDINENQKAVSPSLRLDLEEDLFWDSDRADSRIKALRSSITKELSNSNSSPLYNKISVGEDTSILTFKPFTIALSNSGLLPVAKGNKYSDDSIKYSLYDESNKDHNQEMTNAKSNIGILLKLSYDFVEQNYSDIFKREKYFIVSNRGTYAFICLIGSLNRFLIDENTLTKKSTPEERFEQIRKYLKALLDYVSDIPKEEEEKQLSLLGAGADIKWLRNFQSIVNKKYNEFNPADLIDWNERQNDELQDKGRKFGVEIEKFMKKSTLSRLKEIYGDKWELEIGSIKRDCVDRALQEDEKNHKEGLDKESSDWKDMFNINDYKTIIEKHWTKKPEKNNGNFKTFEDEFSINIGNGFNSKTDKIKWISIFNSHRNLWAHEGTKEKRLNKNEVEFLEMIHGHFYN